MLSLLFLSIVIVAQRENYSFRSIRPKVLRLITFPSPAGGGGGGSHDWKGEARSVLIFFWAGVSPPECQDHKKKRELSLSISIAARRKVFLSFQTDASISLGPI